MATTTPTLDTETYRFLQDYIYRESGIVIEEGKQYLIEARLMPIVIDSHLTSLSALCRALRDANSPPLRKRVVEAMTTHETLFFRDNAPFEGLKREVLPKLIAKRQSVQRLSIWSAAASSGQEIYSVAMLLLEMGLEKWNLDLLGTDLSEQILVRAREGRYMQLEMNRGLPATYLVKHFERESLEWRIKPNLRKMVRFEQFDLRKPMNGKGPFDIVFCRNVLIYFDMPTKKEILAELRRRLVPGGYLVLGSAESTINLDDIFRRVQVGKTMFYQNPGE